MTTKRTCAVTAPAAVTAAAGRYCNCLRQRPLLRRQRLRRLAATATGFGNLPLLRRLAQGVTAPRIRYGCPASRHAQAWVLVHSCSCQLDSRCSNDITLSADQTGASVRTVEAWQNPGSERSCGQLFVSFVVPARGVWVNQASQPDLRKWRSSFGLSNRDLHRWRAEIEWPKCELHKATSVKPRLET